MATETKKSYRMSRKKGLLFAATLQVCLLVAVAVCVEIGCRRQGYRPYSTVDVITIGPSGGLYQSHPTRGWSYRPGQFTLTLPGPYSFTVSHSADGLRPTHPPNHDVSQNKKQVWLFGCSFTHGWALNDSDTFPWQLQELLPNYEVVNFGVDGYGTVQSLIQFHESLAQGRIPKIVVVAYGSFHDDRNAASRLWRKTVVSNQRLGAVSFPYGKMGADGKVQIVIEPLRYDLMPLLRHSALASYLDDSFIARTRNEGQYHEVSKRVMELFADECRARGIKFVVAGIYRAPLTADMLAYCASRGMQTVDISVDLSVPANSNMPFDGHPSPHAARHFAKELEAFLSNNVIDKTESADGASKNGR